MKIINNVNFNKKQLKNAVIERLGNAPSSPEIGQVYFNDGSVTAGDKGYYIYNGSAWSKLTDQSMTAQDILDALKTVDGLGSGLDADLLDGNSSAVYLNRANHTGTQLAATISNFDTQVRTNRLDQLAVPTTSVSLNSQKITNLATPNDATDAATKAYVDAVAQGLDPKQSVKWATTGNIDLATVGANQVIANVDGQFVANNERILVKDQINGDQNGIYVASTAGWQRAADATVSGNPTTLGIGAYVFVDAGSFKGTGWVFVGAPTYWEKFTESTVIIAGTGVSVSTSGGNTTVGINTSVVARKFSADVGGATEVTITHNLGTEDVTISLREKSGTKEFVLADAVIVDTNNVKFIFDTAPSAAQYRATIIG